MGIKIITDSTCDLDFGVTNELNVAVVPLTVAFGEETYKDGVTLSKTEFYQKLSVAKTMPKTSQVNPDDFYSIFKKYIDSGDEVIGIFVSSELSGTYQSAMIAKNMIETDKIHLIDSRLACCALGILVMEAAKLVKEKLSAKAIIKRLDILKEKIVFLAIVGDLKYLKMGGRIPATTAIVGGILGVNPIVNIEKGKLNILGKARGKEKVFAFVANHIEKNSIDADYPIIFGHTHCIIEMEKFRKAISEKFNISTSLLQELGATIGSHAGIGCYGLTYVVK